MKEFLVPPSVEGRDTNLQMANFTNETKTIECQVSTLADQHRESGLDILAGGGILSPFDLVPCKFDV